jgi:hypothetical protein
VACRQQAVLAHEQGAPPIPIASSLSFAGHHRPPSGECGRVPYQRVYEWLRMNATVSVP